MDILIKNMNLPKTDSVTVRIYANGNVDLLLKGTNYRLVDAEAISIPEHGRLGDLDALENKVIEEADYPSHELCTAIDQIRNAPTIVEASK